MHRGTGRIAWDSSARTLRHLNVPYGPESVLTVTDYFYAPLPHRGSWELVFDTSRRTGQTEARKYQPGDEYVIKPYSTVVMINRRPGPSQKSQNMSRLIRAQKSYE